MSLSILFSSKRINNLYFILNTSKYILNHWHRTGKHSYTKKEAKIESSAHEAKLKETRFG